MNQVHLYNENDLRLESYQKYVNGQGFVAFLNMY